LIDDMAALDGDIIILGVGGKVGPCLARMAKRAAPHKRIVGVARFTDGKVKQRLED
jgi:prephenate dehydrogenase